MSGDDSRRGFLKKLGFMGGCAAGVTIIIDYGDYQEREEIEPPTGDEIEFEMGEPVNEDEGTAPIENDDGDDENATDDGGENDTDTDTGNETVPDDGGENETGNETGGDGGGDDTAPDDVVVEIEAAIADEINTFRAGEGLAELAYDDAIAAVARGHSQDMSERDYFAHVSPDGDDHVDRLAAGGVECNGSAENIAYEGGRDLNATTTIAESIADGWFNSDGHRANILGDYDRHGVGVAIREDGRVYATHVFCAD